jgi:hypothetical protein
MISVENLHNNPPLYIVTLEGIYEITISRNMCTLKQKMFEDNFIEILALQRAGVDQCRDCNTDRNLGTP